MDIKWGKVITISVAASKLKVIVEMIETIINKSNLMNKYICIANVHMIVTAYQNKSLRTVMEGAVIVSSDGMPLVWELRRQGFNEAERVSGPDLMMELCERASKCSLPVYFYGGIPEVVKSMEEKLLKNFPDLIVAGIESPPMLPECSEVDEAVVNQIKGSGAKIVFVGLGCPKQELWMHAYSPHIPAVLIGVGAAFDFFAGTVKRAPLWMQKSGLEWFYRLCSEPRRLWKRYLVTNSKFIFYWCVERFRRFD